MVFKNKNRFNNNKNNMNNNNIKLELETRIQDVKNVIENSFYFDKQKENFDLGYKQALEEMLDYLNNK